MHLLSIVGARPQFVKAAMIANAVDCFNASAGPARSLRHTLVHTGQHYDPNMSEVFFKELTLPVPKHSLGVGSGPHGAQTALMLERIESILERESPDVVVVYGDTNSTLAGTLAAVKMHIPVAHIEAGLRSYNRRMPEEINRVLTDHASSLLFCPTTTAVENLRREGIIEGVCLSGDVMLDAVLYWRTSGEKCSQVLDRLGVSWGSYILLTIHRAENTDSTDRLKAILESLLHVPYPVVFPLHPRTRSRLHTNAAMKALEEEIRGTGRIKIIDPVSFLEMLVLEENARIVMTDSGGVQKEAYFLGVPCLTVRDETEWVETLQEGWNTLVPPEDKRALLSAMVRAWEAGYLKERANPNRTGFGRGQAAADIVEAIAGAGEGRRRLAG